MKRAFSARHAGATLAETIVAAGVFMVVSVSIVSGVVALQRNFLNTSDYAVNHAAQLRISDYIARDLRYATTFSQTGSGSSTVITMQIPNYYDPTQLDPVTKKPKPRNPTVNSDGTVSYQDSSTPPKKSNTVRYYMDVAKDTIFREVDGVSRVIADDVADFQILPLDSAVDPNAATDFNLAVLNSKVAEVKVQVNFKTRFGTKTVTQTFYNTTLMRNPRTDVQTNLY